MFDELGKVEKLYRRHPQSPLFARLADLYLRRGKVEQALALCQEGCRRFPHYPTGYLILGKCYEAQGQLEEARSATDQALRLDPENPAGFMHLSRIYRELGIATLALKSLQQAARFDPLSETLAEQVDQLAYAVRVEATAAPGAPEVADLRPPPPEPIAVSRPIESPAAAEEPEEAEPFGVIHAPEEAPPAPAGPEPLAYAGPLEEQSLEDLLKRSEEAMAAREQQSAVASAAPAAPQAAPAAADLPLEDRLEALFRRGNLAAEAPVAPPAAPEPFAAPPAEPEPGPSRPAAPALDEDLFALGAALMAGDSPLAAEPESIAEPEPVAPSEKEPALPPVQEEGLFSPIALEPEDEALEEGLFSALAGGEPRPGAALPPEKPAEDLGLDELIGALAQAEAPRAAPVAPQEPALVQPEALAAETAAEKRELPAPQADPPRPRRADDGELIRLFQEIENQQHQALTSQPLPAPPAGPPAETSDPEGRIATVTLAQIYSSQGFVDRAVETYRKILDQDPDNEEIKRRIAELQQGRKGP
jgi:tetratricopeptide (TPR) repeat protein